MSNRFSTHGITTLAVFVFLLTGIAGCFGGGGGGGGEGTLPPQITIVGLHSLQYNPSVPVKLSINSSKTVNVNLVLSYRTGNDQPYRAMTPVPGMFDPTSLPVLVIPVGGLELTYYWNAMADLGNGAMHTGIQIKAIVLTDTCSMGETSGGPITCDYTDALGGALPPYVPNSTTLPSTVCSASYDQQLPVEGGYDPLVWYIMPPGSQLPYYLELTHDGRVHGTIPENYGPLTISFIAMVRDSNPILPRESAGAFSIFIDCEPSPGCGPPPEILFTSVPPALEGEAYGFQCNAAAGVGDLTWTLAQGVLPDGLIMYPTGLITGTLAVGSAGFYDLTIQVCDSCPDGAQCDSVAVTLEVSEPAIECDPGPTITTTSLPGATEDVPYSQVLLAAGGHGDLLWQIEDGDLPPGLELSDDGIISGSPEWGSGGLTGEDYFFTAGVCDSCPLAPQCDSREYIIQVGPPFGPCPPGPGITTMSPIDPATVDVPYNFTFEASGGVPVIFWQLNNPGSLPSGLMWNATGSISGTPSAGTTTTYTLDITVSDSCWSGAQEDNGVFELTVYDACAPGPEITTLTIPTGAVGVGYDFQFEATGGVGNLSWSHVGGPEFPAGLILESTGQLHGLPEVGTEGDYNYIEIQVADSCPTGSQNWSNLFNLSIIAACAPTPTITTTQLDPASIGLEYNFTLQASDGEGSLIWTLEADSDPLPASLVFSNGTISGIPDAGTVGTYNLHFMVCDSCPVAQCDNEWLILDVALACAPGPAITTTSIPVANVGYPYEFQFEATGGEGALSWWPEPFSLPPTMALDSDGRLWGTPSLGDVGDWPLTVHVDDSCWSAPQSDSADLTLSIQVLGCAPPPEIQNQPSHQQPVGTFLEYRFDAIYGEGLLTWTLLDSSPALPPTVTFSPGGMLVGTTALSDAGIYTLTVEVCDECTDPGIQCDQIVWELDLLEPVGCNQGPPAIEDTLLPTPIPDGSPYSHTMSVSGGDGMLFWFASGLPPGLMLNFETGAITGAVQPEDVGEYIILIGVCDSCIPVPQCDSVEYYWDIQ